MTKLTRRPWSFGTILTCLLLVFTLHGISCQEGTPEAWDNLSQLIPTNSVYKHRDKNASPSPGNPTHASLHSLDENNVMDTPKTKTGNEEHRHEEEEVYEDDYETEPEPEPEKESENSKLSKLTRDTADDVKPSAINTEVEDLSRDEDYLEDPSTSQYDVAYYYYDDYENNNRSRYEAIVDADTLDYPDTEEEEEEEHDTHAGEIKPAQSTTNKNAELSFTSVKSSNLSSVPKSLASEKEQDSLIISTNAEEVSSMEGSQKSYAIVGPRWKPDDSLADSSILIGEAVVSVVTTKSVVNGTISVPTTSSPTTTEQVVPPPSTTSGTTDQPPPSVTTEDSSRILASVQTSRSISGARFLPFPVIDRVEPIDHAGSSEKKTSPPPESTESIIDKLDRVQSELSSGFLVGGFRNAGNTLQLDVLGDRDRNARRRFTTTAKTPVISKFVPRRYNDKRYDQTANSPRPRLETTLDNLEGLLPRDYAVKETTTVPGTSKTGFRWPTSKITTTTEVPEAKVTSITIAPLRKNKTSAVVQDISAFLPPGYKFRKEESSTTDRSLLNDILAKSKVDIASLLPSDYNKKKNDENAKAKADPTTTTVKSTESTSEKSAAPKSIQDLFAKSKFDISALLPKDYEEKDKNHTTETDKEKSSTVTTASVTTEPIVSSTQKPGGFKIVFPSRPGGRKPIHKITTPPSPRGADAPGAVTPKIQKGWPTRATTEFTGWPTPSTTPISIEKLLEAARTATVASVNASMIPITNVITSTSTTSTTTTTMRPTTPGICEDECEVAGTIRLIGNANWVPELLDRNTQEWQQLANEVEREMNFIFSKSAVLANWYKKIRIDSFSQGSILVDYFIELANLEQKVNTQELKVIFHDTLRVYNTNRWNDTKTKGPMRLGEFTIDPKYTDFIVIPKVTSPPSIDDEDQLLPQWAIAMIVIGVGGLLFTTIFGVSVLINRQNASKLKPSISAIYEEEVAKNITSHRSSDYSKPVHTIWTDPDVSWNDKSFESTSNKVLVEKPFQDNKKYNLYDSWRSEWNGYYYNPSHASSKYGGYDSATNLSSRHHPDYDTNF